MPFEKCGKTVTFKSEFLKISFTGVGIEESCPAEKDNDGCFFLGKETALRPAEQITVNKEFCDCEFAWSFSDKDAHGVSIGKTFPAFPSEQRKDYPKQAFTVQNTAAIPCDQVQGIAAVFFWTVIFFILTFYKHFSNIG